MILDQIENEDFRTSLNPEDLWLFDQLKELYGEKVGQNVLSQNQKMKEQGYNEIQKIVMKEGMKDNRVLLNNLVARGINDKTFGVVNSSMNLFKLLICDNMENSNMEKIIKELVLLLGNNNGRLSKNSREVLVQLVDVDCNVN